jgi:hypothetical protein
VTANCSYPPKFPAGWDTARIGNGAATSAPSVRQVREIPNAVRGRGAQKAQVEEGALEAAQGKDVAYPPRPP